MIVVATSEGIEVDGVLLKDTNDIQAFIEAHQPKTLGVAVGITQPSNLYVHLQPAGVGGYWTRSLLVRLSLNNPSAFTALINSHSPFDLSVDLHTIQRLDLITSFGVWQRATLDFYTYLKILKPGTLDLGVSIFGWGARNLSILLGASSPFQLEVPLWGWVLSDVQVAISTTHPPPLEATFLAMPDPGNDLIVRHNIMQYFGFNVDFNAWSIMSDIPVYVWGVRVSDFSTIFTMGGCKPLFIDIPMMTGYKNLFVTLKPASRLMTTIIPVYTIEIKDLYVSINQGWPCNWHSTYTLLSVVFDTAYVYGLDVLFKIIYGSGTPILGAFVNRFYFDTYIKTFDISIAIDEDVGRISTRIMDEANISYDNIFDDIYMEVFHVKFSWPRFKLWSSFSSFSVELFPYRGDRLLDLSVVLVINRQIPPQMPTSQPIAVRQGFQEPIWPDVFQVKEIELWADDGSEIVRQIEIKFGEQIREYYWVSKDQRAYAKNLWEQWSFMARGYLPNADYSGQIDYVTMRTISSISKYDTIDQAIRALFTNFLYTGVSNLQVMCNPAGKITTLNILMDVYGVDRLSHFYVDLEPMHPIDLEITLTPV